MSKYTQSEKVIGDVNTYIAKAQYAGLYGVAIAKGEKNTITDVDGNSYIDFLSGASAVALGYSNQELVTTYSQTALQIAHTCFVYSPNIPTVDLAKKLVEITPGNFQKKVFFGMSGSDSIDGAIKAARKFTKKMGVISFTNAYHGNTGLAAQATGFPGIRNGFLDKNAGFYFVSFPTTAESANLVLQETEHYFKEEKIACFIIEAIQGDGGNLMPYPDFFSKLRKMANKYGVVIIDDETQNGMARSGKWWGIEHFDCVPDLMVIGKALGSGYVPISACVGKAEIIDSLDKAQHVFTFSGHPPSSAVALQVINMIERDSIMERVSKHGKTLISALSNFKQTYQEKLDIEVRGIGLQIGLSIKTKQGDALGSLFGTRCLEKGMYVGYFGSDNEVMRIHPPLTITEEEIQQFLQTLRDICDEYVLNGFPDNTIAHHRRYCLGLGHTNE